MVWFNILTIGGAVAAGMGEVIPALGPVLEPDVYQKLLFVVGITNLVLRSITSSAVDWTKDDSTSVD